MANRKKDVRKLTFAELARENLILRKLLWLNHGHMGRLYGDDGEMQCFPCDFWRDPVDMIWRHCMEERDDLLQAMQKECNRDQDSEGEEGSGGPDSYGDLDNDGDPV